MYSVIMMGIVCYVHKTYTDAMAIALALGCGAYVEVEE